MRGSYAFLEDPVGPAPEAAVISLRDVSVRRNGAVLLDQITWTVRDDERWIVLGPNGAGKTTLLQLAGALSHPSAGEAWVLGQRLGRVDLAELTPRIGLCSAALAGRLPPGELVRDLVLSAAYGVVGRWREQYEDADFERADAMLATMGVASLADRTYGTLSEGERKRVQIARAMMTNPELLLLDEPAAGLDLGAREELVGRLSLLARNPGAPATVLVTHHVEEVPGGFTHALLLANGRIVAAGPLGSALMAENLSRTFDIPLLLDHVEGRWSARALTGRL